MPAAKPIRLPPYCGTEVQKPFLFNPYQYEMLKARSLRICAACGEIHHVDSTGLFICAKCAARETDQRIARKVYRRLGMVGGRRSGKTLTGARGARAEMIVPNKLGWVCGPTFKILHDATMPTLFKIIPENWVAHWDSVHNELLLVNAHVVQFRSLDDPSRGVGMGPHWSWFDEPQKMLERAWDIFRPSLTENLGNAMFTWTPNGFDWTWRRLYKPAFEKHEPGFWMAKCRTLDNPFIQMYAREEVDEARATMPAAMFRQEYEADFVSFVGNVYDWDVEIDPLRLHDDAAIKHFIPEWPQLDSDRQLVIGISAKSGSPCGAVLIVLTEQGGICIAEYLSEDRAVSKHFDQITDAFLVVKDPDGRRVYTRGARWGADENEKYLTVEGAPRGVGIIPTEHYLITGIQRVHSWMYMKRLWFAYTCPKLLDQMRGYRWADTKDEEDGQNPDGERDFRKENELPNAVRHALLTFPTLPELLKPPEGRDLSKMDPKHRKDIERMQAFEKDDDGGDAFDDAPDELIITPGSRRWPAMFGDLLVE